MQCLGLGKNHLSWKGWVQYFLTFINDYFRKTFCYFLKGKGECFSKFLEFKVFVETQIENKFKIWRNHNGGKFTSKEFEVFLKTYHGIQHQKFVAYTPQQNGVVERANQTIVETICNML